MTNENETRVKAVNTLTGPVTLNSKTLIYKGRPLLAGDLRAGDEIEYDRNTGEVVIIRPAKLARKERRKLRRRADDRER
jgi:hypothetical protein